MLKKFFLAIVMLTMIGSIANAAQLYIDPNFGDARFEPADKFHAGCVNNVTVSLKTSANEDINSLRLIMSYEPEKIQILDVKPANAFKNILDSKIEYDKVVVTMLDANLTNDKTTKLFTISFKSNETTTDSILAIQTPSYVMTKNSNKIPVFVDQKLAFAKVSECDPDTIPPTITITKPINTSTTLNLDSYFVFTIKDMGKGVDKNSLVVKFDGVTYSGSDTVFNWQDDYLAFLPPHRLPVDKDVDLQISISDKQVYGGPNTIKKNFSFMTSSGVSFDHNFTPTMLRNMLGKMESIYATYEECEALSALSNNQLSGEYFASIKSMAKKVGCIIQVNTVINEVNDNTKKAVKSVVFISVFAILGWTLFVISFILKMHYRVSYKKHKRISKSLQSSLPKQ